MAIGGRSHRLAPMSRGAAVSAQPWEARPGTRLRAFYDVWLALRALDAPMKEAALEEIAEWADAPRSSGRVL